MVYLISINYKWLLSVDQAVCESYTCSDTVFTTDGGMSATGELMLYPVMRTQNAALFPAFRAVHYISGEPICR